jgi:hypothetical protein
MVLSPFAHSCNYCFIKWQLITSNAQKVIEPYRIHNMQGVSLCHQRIAKTCEATGWLRPFPSIYGLGAQPNLQRKQKQQQQQKTVFATWCAQLFD